LLQPADARALHAESATHPSRIMNTHFSLLTAVLVIATACTRTDEHATHAANGTTTAAPGMASDLTALSQSNAKADLDHLAEIRKALVADDALSVAAKNVQVLTKDGNVLLRGKVASGLEREAVERHARACPATRSVDDQIEVGAQ